MERLQRMARRLGRTPSETSALLVDEALRAAEFAFVEFRDSPVGRQAYIKGATLAVWEVIMVARDHDLDAARTAAYLEWPEHKVHAALNYAAAYPDEINHALADNDSYDFEKLSRLLPQLERFVVLPVGDGDAIGGSAASAGETP
jgi:uncharacterized protein (DUF433 family)